MLIKDADPIPNRWGKRPSDRSTGELLSCGVMILDKTKGTNISSSHCMGQRCTSYQTNWAWRYIGSKCIWCFADMSRKSG